MLDEFRGRGCLGGMGCPFGGPVIIGLWPLAEGKRGVCVEAPDGELGGIRLLGAGSLGRLRLTMLR